MTPAAVFAQKKQFKQGLALEQQGDLQAAMSRFKAALYKNRYYNEATVALDRCAQQVASDWLGDYFQARVTGAWEEAASIADKLTQLQEELRYFSIELAIPAYQRQRLEADAQEIPAQRLQLLRQQYAEGQLT